MERTPSTSAAPNPREPGDKPSTSDRFKALIAEWGMLFFFVWFGLFGIVLVGFALAIKLGFRVESTAGTWGTLGAAYVATQLTKPLRLGATIVITPALGALLKRWRKRQSGASTTGANAAVPGAANPGQTSLDETPSRQA